MNGERRLIDYSVLYGMKKALLQELPEPASELGVRVDISFVIKTR